MEKKDLQNFNVTVLGVIFDPRKKEILIGKRKNDYSAPDLRWCFVGGQLTTDEPIDKILKRKIKERTGLNIKNLGAIFVDNSSMKNNFLLVYFLCEAVEGEEKIGEKFEELKWISPKDISKYFNHPIHVRLKEYLDNLA